MATFIQKIKVGIRKIKRMVDGAEESYSVDQAKYPALWALFKMAQTQSQIEEYETDPELREDLKTSTTIKNLYKYLKHDLDRYTKMFTKAAPKTNWAEAQAMLKQKQREARKADVYDDKIFKFVSDRIAEYGNNFHIVRDNRFDKHLNNPLSR